MERIGFLLRVKPEKKEEYKRIHRNVWPELLAELKKVGIRNYSIYMKEDGEEFGYLECDNFKRAMGELGKSEVNLRWQEWMKEYLATPVEMSKEEPLQLLEEVFHMD